MKIKLLIIACIFTTAILGMENPNTFSITSFGTKITVTQESLFTACEKTDLLILGTNDQNTLKEITKFDQNVGTITTYPKCSFAYQQGHDIDISDATYKSADYYDNATIQIKSISQAIPCELLCIVEPLIRQNLSCTWHSKYQVIRPCLEVPTLLEFYKKEAMIQACNDLKMCYEKTLAKGLEILTKPSKQITLATLSANFGIARNKAAPIAINTTLKFIKENIREYDCINFFVEKNADFKLYKKLLLEYNRAIAQRICLISSALTAIENLPRELHNIILFLTMTP